MLTFSLVSSALGALVAFTGFWAAYGLDLPLGPAEVALAGVLLAAVALGRALARVGRRSRIAGATAPP
jgi:ABC-type Mn2+/Zn2+ transport system permease subunit